MNLRKEDLFSWAKNAALFLIPVVVIYITFAQNNLSDGFTWDDLKPNAFVTGSMVAYLLNESLAFFKKWLESSQTP